MTKSKSDENLRIKYNFEKCLVVHSHSTPISLLSIWTNNVRDRRGSVVGPYFFNNIIGPHKQEWDRSEMRVYNQVFLLKFFHADMASCIFY
jgi:hypothetical protein